jgi:acyl-CoA reductase-like NAD-dependent aldehyde dehydrogenase
VLGYIDRALAAGLRSVTGDGRCELPAALAGGSFVKPVVFVDVGDAQAESRGRACH